MASARRRSYEAGHRPKFLVFVDETPECSRAVRFGARRVARLGAKLVMLAVSAPPESFEWLGVGDVMRAEAEEEARAQLEVAATEARQTAGVEPELVVRIGKKQDEILKLIEEDEDIAYMILAAGTSSDGPGPLVTNFAGVAASTFPVPVVIVPGSLTDEDIDALAG